MFKKIVITLILSLFALSASASLFTKTPFSSKPAVQLFIKQMVKKHHFNEAELVKLFDQVKVRASVIRHIKAPLEQKPWYHYQTLFVTEWRIREGVKFWNKYQTALERAEKKIWYSSGHHCGYHWR